MADQTTLYDLVLLLSSDAPDERKTRILSAVESAISGGGSIERNDDWGQRPMAYEIRHRPEAEYHLLQFHAPPSVIEELSHTLRITDGVLRFRIIKVRRGTPPVKAGAPPVVAAVASPGLAASDSRSGRTPAPSPEEHEQAGAPEVAEEAPAPPPSPAADAGDGSSSPE